MRTVHLLIKGRVQGVFFRATAKEKAEQFNITGWIKNTAAGDVEAMISGTEEEIQLFINWCHKGPAGATVTDVIIEDSAAEIFGKFLIVR